MAFVHNTKAIQINMNPYRIQRVLKNKHLHYLHLVKILLLF